MAQWNGEITEIRADGTVVALKERLRRTSGDTERTVDLETERRVLKPGARGTLSESSNGIGVVSGEVVKLPIVGPTHFGRVHTFGSNLDEEFQNLEAAHPGDTRRMVRIHERSAGTVTWAPFLEVSPSSGKPIRVPVNPVDRTLLPRVTPAFRVVQGEVVQLVDRLLYQKALVAFDGIEDPLLVTMGNAAEIGLRNGRLFPRPNHSFMLCPAPGTPVVGWFVVSRQDQTPKHWARVESPEVRKPLETEIALPRGTNQYLSGIHRGPSGNEQRRGLGAP